MIALCGSTATAIADPETPASEASETPAAPETEVPITAADVAAAPPPGAEHGRLDPLDRGDGIARRIGRGLLWIPRLPFEIIAQPIRGTLYLQDRYDIVGKLTGVFFTTDRKAGVFPTALFETGFGLNVGARAMFKDIFGGQEKLKMRVGFGGQFQRVAKIELDTGNLLPGPVTAGVEARYELRNRDHFYGYGNGDLEMATLPIDPLVDDTAVSTRFGMRVLRVASHLRIELPSNLAVTLTGAVAKKTYKTSDYLGRSDTPLEEAYDVERIPGFRDGTKFLYTEAELAWGTRRAASFYDPPGMRGAGNLVLVYAGRQHGFDEEAKFFRGGAELQHYIRLARGPRVLELRAYGELVTGSRDEVPFTELPRLGGRKVLRGYEVDRFRDRVATVAQAAYMWGLSYDVAASIFVDAGRVHSSLETISTADLRVGYGVALEIYSSQGMLVRTELASSIDGGLFAYIAFDPAFDTRSRVERY
ncbi:MAG: BamA/TamA family outer membrane protein [Deltaproteobacteria bacterium]|nr:BamA/TamA family outer membrane protein [Deltaproteobacteria bacterium]MDQ3297620.1 BamA/TamA family outer membrane protein [Myxococcota bacterium]